MRASLPSAAACSTCSSAPTCCWSPISHSAHTSPACSRRSGAWRRSARRRPCSWLQWARRRRSRPPATPPRLSCSGMAGSCRGLAAPPRRAPGAPASPVVLWYGGLWPWFDGATALEAFALVARELPTARLRILGGRHPRGEAPDSLDDVLALATTRGVGDRVESLPWA